LMNFLDKIQNSRFKIDWNLNFEFWTLNL
jgi:hypothetical protein